jgi:regulator of cell morphogenesis and NO signaling
MIDIVNIPLAKMVMMNSAVAPVLEKYQLDFCCRGKQSLVAAMSGRQEEMEALTMELQDVFNNNDDKAVDFDKYSLSDLTDHIINVHHRYVREHSPVILNHLEKVASKHGDRHPEMKQILQLFKEVTRELDQHMMKEEVMLFPGIKSLHTAIDRKSVQIAAPIHVMEAEHESAGSGMSAIRLFSDNFTPPADACTTYRLSLEELRIFELNLHQHVHLENNILFPKALAVAQN